jgi:hypothetical protein
VSLTSAQSPIERVTGLKKTNYCLVLLCGLFLQSECFAAGPSLNNHVPQSRAGVFQLIENRSGRKSCWGVIIQLSKARLRRVVRADQMVIREGKYGRDLRGMMNWSVDRSGKKLVIKLKPGMGDFGTGNTVEVQIDRSAFLLPMPSSDNRFDWSIGTDPL